MSILTPELIARAKYGELTPLGEAINRVLAIEYLTIQELVAMYHTSGLNYELAARACSSVRTEKKLHEARKVLRRLASSSSHTKRLVSRELSNA